MNWSTMNISNKIALAENLELESNFHIFCGIKETHLAMHD